MIRWMSLAALLSGALPWPAMAQDAAQQPPPETKRDEPAPTAAAPAPAPAATVAPSPAPGAVTQEDLAGVQADLENFKYQWQNERDRHTGLSTRPLTLGGLVQARAVAQDRAPTRSWDVATGKFVNGSVYDRKSSFELGSAQVNLSGILFRDYADGRNLGYAVRVGSTGGTSLGVVDANLTYAILATVSPDGPRLSVTLGQQQLPFGLEVAASDELKPVINNAQFAGNLALARRDIGLVVKGELGVRYDYGYNYRQALVAFALGALNGAGPSTSDDNGEKDFLARAAFTLPSDYNSWLRQLTLGATAYVGRQNRYGYVTDRTAGLIKVDPDKTPLGLGRKNRLGVDVYYNHHPFGLTYEYVVGHDGLADPASASTTATLDATATRFKAVRSESHVATAFFNIGEQFVKGYRNQGRFDDWWPKSHQLFVRVDLFDPDTSVPSNRSDVYTGGLNVFFAETTKFQLNYSWKKDQAAKTRQELSQVLAQLQYGW